MTEHELKSLVLESNLPPNAKFLFMVLLHYRNNKTGLCYPSQTTLACSMSVCQNSVRAAIKQLCDAGFVRTETKRIKGYKYDNTFYIIEVGVSSDDTSNDMSVDISNEISIDIAPNEHKLNKLNKLKKEDTIVSSKKNLNGCRIDYFLTNHPDGGIDSQNCPDDLGNWAIQEFKWDVPKTVGVWAGFCDYWLAKTGAGATKRDWPATWRNWCRKAAEHDARSDYILTQQAKRSYAK